MSIADQLYALVKSFPQEQASEVLTFAEFIRAKHLKDNPVIGAVASVTWAELVHSLAGAWGEDFPDLEDIRIGSRQDTQRESL